MIFGNLFRLFARFLIASLFLQQAYMHFMRPTSVMPVAQQLLQFIGLPVHAYRDYALFGIIFLEAAGALALLTSRFKKVGALFLVAQLLLVLCMQEQSRALLEGAYEQVASLLASLTGNAGSRAKQQAAAAAARHGASSLKERALQDEYLLEILQKFALIGGLLHVVIDPVHRNLLVRAADAAGHAASNLVDFHGKKRN